jgi:formylglycine-generating enzyme required for sulfatase activity
VKHLGVILFALFILGSTALAVCPSSDLSGDCIVDFADFAVLANGWQTEYDASDLGDMTGQWWTGGSVVCPSSDYSGDCFVNFEDFAVLANEWLTVYDANDFGDMIEQWWKGSSPAPDDMVWVSVDEPAFSGQMSKYETTNAQYCQFLNEALASGDVYVDSGLVYGADGLNTGADFIGEIYCNIGYDPRGVYSQITYSGGSFSVVRRDGYNMSNHPVVEVTWYGATAFCNYYGFRLPTEWEWEAVADYDGTYIYGCGETIDQIKANYAKPDYANPLDLTDWPFTAPVDHYNSYGYGLNDMAGNVDEWTSSTYEEEFRALRGGAWYDEFDLFYTVSFRYGRLPNSSDMASGFRVCR